MNMSKIFRSFAVPRQVGSADESKTSRDAAKVSSALDGQTSHDAPCSGADAVSAGSARAQLKNRLFRFVPWSNKANKTTPSDNQRKNPEEQPRDASKKQAWGASSCMPNSMPGDPVTNLVGVVSTDDAHRKGAIDGHSVAMPPQEDTSAAAEPKHSPRPNTPPPRNLSDERAQDPCDLSGNSLAAMALEALEQASQQFAAPHQQQDPLEELEREWAESIFVNMEHEHQQQLRRVIGLPILSYPSGSEP